MKTFATMFSGGELVGMGARAAGLSHTWGIEHDAAIAGVAHANGFEGVIVADVLAVDPHTLAAPDVLHASPVCTRASQANSSAELNEDGTKEAPLDIAMGEKVAHFIDVLRPRVFTLENVYAYRNFKAFGKITAALTRGGYFWDYDNLNSADYGVPQTRHRLILRAVRGALLPHLPPAEPWQGWYAAIEDLIPDLPESKFAPWQLARLPDELTGRGVMVNVQNQGEARGRLHRQADEPTMTVINAKSHRAFIVQGTSTMEVREADQPSAVVMGTVHAKSAMPRAFLVASNSNPESRGDNWRRGDEPAHTTVPNALGRARAYIVDGGGNAGFTTVTVRQQDEPMFTIDASANKVATRAWLSAGRVVSMTDRCLARFQSVPDGYRLPDKKSLSCKVIGNGVPPLWYQKIIGPLA